MRFENEATAKNDLLARFKALKNRRLPIAGCRPYPHRAYHESVGRGLHKHDILLIDLLNSICRNDKHRLALPDRDFRICQHFRAEPISRVAQHDAYLHDARGWIELLAQIGDLAAEVLAGIARQCDSHRLAEMQSSEVFLPDGREHPHLRQVADDKRVGGGLHDFSWCNVFVDDVAAGGRDDGNFIHRRIVVTWRRVRYHTEIVLEEITSAVDFDFGVMYCCLGGQQLLPGLLTLLDRPSFQRQQGLRAVVVSLCESLRSF